MTNTNRIQISGKVGDVICLIGGEDAASFQDAVMSTLGPEAGEHIGALFTAALLDVPADKGMAVAQQFAQATTPAQASVTTPQTPAVSDGPREETDKWGSLFTYSVPGAPSCPHGQRVQKKATSQAGKKYTGWVCPTQTPHAFRNKVTKADCAMEFPPR